MTRHTVRSSRERVWSIDVYNRRVTSDVFYELNCGAVLAFGRKVGQSELSSHPIPSGNASWDLAAASMYSSGRDLQRWLDVINSDDFLPDSLQEILSAPVARLNQSKAMGIASEILDVNGVSLQAQVGAARGFYAITLRNPSTLSSVVVLSNFGESPTFRVKPLNDLATLLAQ